MRCAECEPDPLIAARFCECCGREFVPHQTQAEETSPVNGQLAETPQVSGQAGEADAGSGLYDWAPKPNPASELRCPNCGGPSLDRDRCQACQQASSIECTDPATPARNEATKAPKAEPTASSQDPSESTTSANRETPQALSKATTPVKDNVAAAWAKAVETEAVKTQEARPKRAKSDTLHMEKVRRPADVTRRSSVPVAPQHRDHPLALAGVAVVIAAIGVGAYWLRIDKGSVIARVEQLVMFVPNDSPTKVADTVDRTLPQESPAIATTSIQDAQSALAKERPVAQTPAALDRNSAATTSSRAPAASEPKPVTPVRPPRRAAVPAVASKPVRAQGSTRDVPAVPVLTSVPMIAPPVVDVVATAPAPATPPPAAGPFFETRDVNESPRVENRAEPRLPDELRGRSIKEVVVVRALVSQSGHPSRVSLLRRTKTGPQLDDVVVEAVNHWTFSPAKKKGEAVSCWFNFAVQVGGAE